MMIWYPEDAGEKLPDELPVGVGAEARAEGEERPGGSQAVSGQLQLGHRVDVLNL